MASSTTKDKAVTAAGQYDEDEAVGEVTPRKVELSSEVNLEGRSSRGSVVGSPEEVIQLSEAVLPGKVNTKDAVEAWLDLRHNGSASQREMDLAISRIADSVGWAPEPGKPLDHEDFIPDDVKASLEREKSAAKK